MAPLSPLPPPHTQVGFVNTSLTYISPFCGGPNTTAIFTSSFKRLYGEENVRALPDGRILVTGQHWASFDLLNVSTNSSGMCCLRECVLWM